MSDRLSETHGDPHEQLHRLRKAIRLADGLAAFGYTDLTLNEITMGHLEAVSRLAGVASASPDTWDIVQALLADRRLVLEHLTRETS